MTHPMSDPVFSTPAHPTVWDRVVRVLSGVWPRKLAADLQIRTKPTWWAFALTVVDSALTVLNQSTFNLPTTWRTAVTILLGVLGYLAIGPVLGPKFKAYIHLPARLAGGIGIGLLVLMVVIQQDVSLPYRAIFLGVIQFFGCLGFAPAYVPTA